MTDDSTYKLTIEEILDYIKTVHVIRSASLAIDDAKSEVEQQELEEYLGILEAEPANSLLKFQENPDKSLKLAARILYEANPPVDVDKYRDEIHGFINDVASSSQFAMESDGTAEKDENVKRAFVELRIDMKEKRNAAWQALKEGKAI